MAFIEASKRKKNSVHWFQIISSPLFIRDFCVGPMSLPPETCTENWFSAQCQIKSHYVLEREKFRENWIKKNPEKKNIRQHCFINIYNRNAEDLPDHSPNHCRLSIKHCIYDETDFPWKGIYQAHRFRKIY